MVQLAKQKASTDKSERAEEWKQASSDVAISTSEIAKAAKIFQTNQGEGSRLLREAFQKINDTTNNILAMLVMELDEEL